MTVQPTTCPNCHSSRILRTSNTSRREFFCPHCDHIWLLDESAVPRVLVVDDEPGIRALANRTLANAGYHVVTAADGVEGLDIDEHQPQSFDVFLLDVRMPKMTGDEVAQELRRRHPDCKVLYFTGFSDQLFNRKPTLWDNEYFIEKPATPTALLQAVSLLLYGHTHGPN